MYLSNKTPIRRFRFSNYNSDQKKSCAVQFWSSVCYFQITNDRMPKDLRCHTNHSNRVRGIPSNSIARAIDLFYVKDQYVRKYKASTLFIITWAWKYAILSCSIAIIAVCESIGLFLSFYITILARFLHSSLLIILFYLLRSSKFVMPNIFRKWTNIGE